MIYLICMHEPKAAGPRASAYILGKSRGSVLQLLCNTMQSMMQHYACAGELNDRNNSESIVNCKE